MAYYAFVTDDHSGETLASFRLHAKSTLDCTHYARKYAESVECRLAEPDGYVPTGCADITVKLANHAASVRCWDSKSYFLE